MNVEQQLKKVPLFEKLTSAELEEVARIGQTQFVAGNTKVYKENDPADKFYVVLEGTTRLSMKNAKGGEADLIRFKPGDWFGEVELIDGRPRKMRATTISPCQFFLFSRTDFLSLLSKSPWVLSCVLQRFSAKLQQRSALVAELRFQEERVRAQAEIERHRSISQMVAGVAHEINTPLGIINNAASLLSEKLTPKTIPELAKDPSAEIILTDLVDAAALIQKNADRSAKLVESFKKLSARNVTGEREQADFASLTEEAMGLYRLQARKSKLQLKMIDELDQAERTWKGFPEKYTQIILNLLTNIDRYAYPGGIGGEVVVTVSQHIQPGMKAQFRVVVQDFGCGIPKENLPKVFDAFFTTGRALGGTGLGLAIVHNLVTDALQGTISLSSEPNQGTRVEILLPLVVHGDHDDPSTQQEQPS